jgi:hypothetical protein
MSDKNQSTNRKRHVGEVIIVLLILGAMIALLYYVKLTGIPFKSFTESNVLAIVTSMFVVAVFMERAIDAILTPIRAPDRQRIERELEDIRKDAEIDDSKKKEQKEKERELEVYKLNTAQRAYWLSFFLGLVISFAGVRALAGLVEPMALEGLGDTHRTFFSFVDIVLTGGVIAGGSAAIDKIGRGISSYFNLKSAADPKPSDKPSQ